jgi:hypothetical protein
VYTPFPALLPFLKWILLVVFCEGVQRSLRFCLDQLGQNGDLSVLTSTGEAEDNSRVCMVDVSHVVFGLKFPGEKGNVRQHVVMMQQPVLLSPEFGTKFDVGSITKLQQASYTTPNKGRKIISMSTQLCEIFLC